MTLLILSFLLMNGSVHPSKVYPMIINSKTVNNNDPKNSLEKIVFHSKEILIF